MTGTVQRRRPKFDPALALVITSYALRSCFPTKRRIGLALPAAGALLFALLARLIPDPAPQALAEVANGGLFGVVLPVGCLVIGDAVLGSEVRAGTLHFTWLSPAGFATIVAGRWLAGFTVALARQVMRLSRQERLPWRTPPACPTADSAASRPRAPASRGSSLRGGQRRGRRAPDRGRAGRAGLR